MYVVNVGDDSVIDRDDEVAVPNAGGVGDAVGVGFDNLDRLIGEQIELPAEVAREPADGGLDAELSAADFAVLKHFGSDPANRAAGDRETKPLGEGDDRRIDADDPAARID